MNSAAFNLHLTAEEAAITADALDALISQSHTGDGRDELNRKRGIIIDKLERLT